MRVHELAKDLRQTSKQFVAKLQEIGIDVKTHMALLTDEQVAKIRQAFAGPPPKPAAPGGKPALRPFAPGTTGVPAPQNMSPSLVLQRAAAIQRTRTAQTAAADAARRTNAPANSAAAAAAIAARMRRGRPQSETTVEAPAPPPPQAVKAAPAPAPIPAQQARPAGPPPPARGTRPPGGPSRAPAAPPPPPETDARSRGRAEGRNKRKRGGPETEELVVPTIEVMRLDDKPARGRRRGGRGRAVPPRRGEVGRGGVRRPGTEGGDRIAPSFVLAQPAKRPMMRPRMDRGARKPEEPKVIRVQGDISVAQFAHKTGISIADVMKSLINNHGQMLTINQTLPVDLVELLALEFNVEVEIVPESDELDVAKFIEADEEAHLASRPPVVTVMGHVDHGKTSLLDVIRKANVAAGEAGGITQHIGAYHVETPKGVIVFLDTPGHEAFTSMRARGAQVTDIVILVVAADDPLMPQALEAINHAREADVPIIVAVNKVDLPGANPQRVINELMGHGLVPESHGGETLFVHVSAKKQMGIAELLDAILLQAEMLELRSNPERKALGIVVESFNDPQRGATCTVLVQKGTLRLGDSFVVGQQYGRVKAMFDDKGTPIEQAGPSMPAEIIGLDGVPEAGEILLAMETERKAREIAQIRADRRRIRGLEYRKHVSLEGLKEMVDKGDIKELRVILKADVQGSLEAVRESLLKIIHPEIKVRILHAAVGGVNESDVALADASDAIILAFNIRPDVTAAEAAQRSGVEIKTYQVIYHLLNEVKAAMVGMLEKKFREVTVGRAEVRSVFRASKLGSVAGSYISSGEARRSCRARLLRGNAVVWDGRIANLRRYKDDVASVAVGLECGIGLENYHDFKEGDNLEFYELEEIPASI